MKTLVFTVFLITIFITSAFGQDVASQKQNRLMVDREADGLKGKVKQVIEETMDLKFENGKFVESGRETDSVTEYDEQGNRIKRDAYSSGKVFLKAVYGTLDGERISKEEFINDADSPPILVVNPKKEEKQKDNSFSYKFRYKYDENGNRVEESWISNTGETWIQDTIVFDEKGNITKQIRRHRGESKISSVDSFKYNDKGFLIEETITLADDEPEKYESTEFDSNGNWVKRVVKRKKRDGSFEPFLICYRKILYFN
ncbi:MAG: hypothetical protein ACR2N3_05375 [Pyrinomonadaceae bacterium]